jgi:hypothetical protein
VAFACLRKRILSMTILLAFSVVLAIVMAVAVVQSSCSPRTNWHYYAALIAAVAGLVTALLEAGQFIITLNESKPGVMDYWDRTHSAAGTVILIGILLAFVGGFFSFGWKRFALVLGSFVLLALHVLTVLANTIM